MTYSSMSFNRTPPLFGGDAYGGFGQPDLTSGMAVSQPAISYPFKGFNLSPYTGQPDYLGSMPTASGASQDTISSAMGSMGNAPSWGQGFGQSLRDIGLIGGTDANGNKVDGWGGLGLSAASSLLNGFMAMKQYGIARDSLNASKEEFSKNYAAQQKQINASLEDRQKARIASNPGAYESVDAYMKKNGI